MSTPDQFTQRAREIARKASPEIQKAWNSGLGRGMQAARYPKTDCIPDPFRFASESAADAILRACAAILRESGAVEALQSIPAANVSHDASFVMIDSWKWTKAMDKRHAALANLRALADAAKGEQP